MRDAFCFPNQQLCHYNKMYDDSEVCCIFTNLGVHIHFSGTKAEFIGYNKFLSVTQCDPSIRINDVLINDNSHNTIE